MFWYYFFPPLMELIAAAIIYFAYLRPCWRRRPCLFRAASATLVFIYGTAASNFFIRDYLNHAFALWISGICVALLLMWAMGAFFYQIGRWVKKRWGKKLPWPSSARWPAVLGKVYFYFFIVVYPLLALWGGHQLPRIVHLNLALRPPPEQTPFNLKVAFLSDLHLGTWQGTTSYLAKVVDLVNQEHPDLILLGGDLVDHEEKSFLTLLTPLKKLRAPLGIYFALGNHECLAARPHLLEELKNFGITTLVNQNVVVAGRLNLVGVGDEDCRHWGAAYLPQMPLDLDPHLPTILLAHRPNLLRQASMREVTLALMGHTHGGQIEPFALLPRFTNIYFKGLYQVKPSYPKKFKTAYAYVNQGTGTSGPPMRFLTFSEITILQLQL
jgi:hypothetical protein